MFCNNCGTSLEDGAKFCPNCGSKIDNVVAPATEVAVETTAEQVAEIPVENLAPVAPVEETVNLVEEKQEEPVKEEVAPVATVVPAAAVASTIASVADEPAKVSAAPIAPVAPATADEPKKSKKSKKEDRKAKVSNLPDEYKPMSVGAYIGFTILSAIPGLGWIFVIIFSFAGKNVNRKNFMRSFLVWYIIAIVLAAGTAAVLMFVLPDTLSFLEEVLSDVLLEFGF